MYEKFFGFRERPFQLVPNPAYLFLSRGHEEALAHLKYAVSQGDGFVEITGEVGTGKTTLCRVLLNELDDKTEVAYIFNPMLDAVQLLAAICNEFGIPGAAENAGKLIDRLNVFLVEKKRQGRHVIVLVDEAQNLSRDVLEQLRLLSNLETTTSKLLQIILVGQPELREMLDTRELRQLRQRITLSCHLSPLDFRETCEYIHHRIQIAAQRPDARFTWTALRAIYKYSGGIPRLVNIACDRAMLAAYGLSSPKVTGPIARSAVRELVSGGTVRKPVQGRSRYAVPVILVFGLLAAVFIFRFPQIADIVRGMSSETLPVAEAVRPPEPPVPEKTAPPSAPEPVSVPAPEVQKPAPETPIPEPVLPSAEKTAEIPENAASPDNSSEIPEKKSTPAIRPLADILKPLDTFSSRRLALAAAIKEWQDYASVKPSLDGISDPPAFFRMAGMQNAFSIHPFQGDLAGLRQLNLPAVMEFFLAEGLSPVYLALIKAGPGQLTLKAGDEVFVIMEADLSRYWTGTAYVPWKNFFGLTGTIPRNASEESVLSLKLMLTDMGFDGIDATPVYDEPTREAVRRIQERHGVEVDGAVGPVTKIILYNEVPSLKIPHISVVD